MKNPAATAPPTPGALMSTRIIWRSTHAPAGFLYEENRKSPIGVKTPPG